MLLCTKIRLEVSEQDAETLEFMQGKCRALYNWWVMRLRTGEKWHFAEAKRSLQESRKYDPELNAVYGKLLADVFYRAVYNEWGLYAFVQMLTYKCALYGKDLVFLDERNTSKQCSGCGNLQAMPLWKRTYCCTVCGLVMDRDENSAVNILTRYLARLGPHTPLECGVLQDGCLDVAGVGPAQAVEVQKSICEHI